MSFPNLELFQILLIVSLIYWITRQNLITISGLLFIFLKNPTKVSWVLGLILLPGTFFHELTHLLIAELLMVRSFNLSLLPKFSNGQICLGEVTIEKRYGLRRFLIGIAPTIIGLLIISLLTFKSFEKQGLWYMVFYYYLLFEISQTMFSSTKDLEGSIIGGLIFIILVYLFFVLSQIINTQFISGFVLRIQSFWDVFLDNLLLGLIKAFVINGLILILLFCLRLFIRNFNR